MTIFEQRSILLVFFFVGGLGLFAFLSLWACRAKLHWFWRASAPLALLTACRMAGSHELVALFSGEGLAIGIAMLAIGGLRACLARRAPGRPTAPWRPPTFATLDFLLATPLAGLVAAELPNLMPLPRLAPPEAIGANWWLAGAGVGLAAVTAYVFQSLSHSSLWRCLMMIVATPGIGLALDMYDENPLVMGMQTRLDGRFCLITSCAGVLVAFALHLAQAAGAQWMPGAARPAGNARPAGASRSAGRRDRRWLAQGTLALLGLAIFAPLAFAVWEARPRYQAIASTDAPSPDGFGEALQPLRRIKWGRFRRDDPERATIESLSRFAEQNRIAIRSLRAILDDSSSLGWSLRRLDQQRRRDFRSLAKALFVAGVAAERTGDQEEAVECFAAISRFGAATMRGGAIRDRRVGWTAAARGMSRLRALAPRLTAAQCRGLLATLDDNQRRRESLAHAIERSEQWRWADLRWSNRLVLLLDRALCACNEPDARFIAGDCAGQTEESLLRCELALRLYHLDHGNEPRTLGELVPSYVAAIPIDYFCDGPVQYARRGTGHVLYSVGLD